MSAASNAYKGVIKQLYQRNVQFPVSMGLQNSYQLYHILGKPLADVPVIHVGGTNGKGSVCYKLAETLRLCGMNVGLFVSPHISSFRERIQINGSILNENDVLESVPMILRECEKHNIPATFFELTTALAFHHFGRRCNNSSGRACDVVVMEVGLGGRLDATNILTNDNICLSVITSVQLDHVKILGPTVDAIAREKAGIMKPGVDVLVGPHAPLDVLKECANKAGANLFTISDVLSNERSRLLQQQVHSVLPGDIDNTNIDISQAALQLLTSYIPHSSDIASQRIHHMKGIFREAINLNSIQTGSHIIAGLKKRPPCRFEIFPKLVDVKLKELEIHNRTESRRCRVNVILDIAHNIDAITTLVQKMKSIYGSVIPVSLIVGFCADKDVSNSVKQLLQLCSADKIYCVAAQHPRSLAATELRKLVIDVNSSMEQSAPLPPPVMSSMADTFQAAVTSMQHSLANKTIGSQACNDLASRLVSIDPSFPCDGVVLVTGSAFIMSEARAVCCDVVEPRDGDILHELTSSQASTGSTIGRDSQECFKVSL